MNSDFFVIVTACIIAMSFMVNTSISNLSVEEGLGEKDTFFNINNSHIDRFRNGDNELVTDVSEYLPSSQQNTNVGEADGNWFSDTFGVFRDYIVGAGTIILDLVNALPNLLKLIFRGDFTYLAFGFGYIWLFIFVYFLIGWIRGT